MNKYLVWIWRLAFISFVGMAMEGCVDMAPDLKAGTWGDACHSAGIHASICDPNEGGDHSFDHVVSYCTWLSDADTYIADEQKQKVAYHGTDQQVWDFEKCMAQEGDPVH